MRWNRRSGRQSCPGRAATLVACREVVAALVRTFIRTGWPPFARAWALALISVVPAFRLDLSDFVLRPDELLSPFGADVLEPHCPAAGRNPPNGHGEREPYAARLSRSICKAAA